MKQWLIVGLLLATVAVAVLIVNGGSRGGPSLNGASISADFPFESKFVSVLDSKMHYVEQGRGDPILFIHGQPSSSYLWRNVIPHAAKVGRAIAVDLIGFGKSDKPDIEYRFFDHVRYLDGFIEALGLKNVTLVIHDWGSMLGFYYAMRHPGNVKGIAFMEAMLEPIPGYDFWEPQLARFMQAVRTPEVGWDMVVNQNVWLEQMLPAMQFRTLSDRELAFYREPFKTPQSRKPIWRFPQELPIGGQPADVYQAQLQYLQWLKGTDTPKLLLYAKPGIVITEPAVRWARENLPNLQTVYIGEGLHFVQEDHPHEIGRALVAWYGQLPR